MPKQTYEDVQQILQTNKIGSKSTRTEFLLKGKLVCGLCGKNMQGESGTSHTGRVMYYYKCMARKRNKSCTKSALPKEKFDKFVVDITHRIFCDQDNINLIANEVMHVHEKRMKDKSVLSVLEKERDEIQRSLANIMKAIERGIFNDTTQTRMNQLEQQLSDIQGKIKLEQFKEQNLLTKEKVVDYLTNSVLKKPKQMIQTLVRKIVVYEDNIEIYYNYTDETNPGDNNPRDTYLLSGSDSSVILGGHGTNTNPNKKNYPGSDSSVMVEINGLEPSTS